MASAHIGKDRVAPSSNGTTSAGIDSSGGNFVFVYVNSFTSAAAPTLSDSKSNTYTALTARTVGNIRIQGFYCQGATCGPGHTWTLSGSGSFCTAYAVVRSGMATSGGPDGENNGTAIGTTIQPGSVMPTEAGTTSFVGVTSVNPPTTIGETYTIAYEDAGSGSGFAGGLAYKYLTDTTPTNPTWTTGDGSGGSVAFIATFKESAGGGGGGSAIGAAAHYYSSLIRG